MKKIAFAVGLGLLLGSPAVADEHAAGSEKHWSYSGETGPAHWGDFSETCAKGKQQSPINIITTDVVKGNAPRLSFHYADPGTGHPTETNNGHTIQISVPAGRFITLDGDRYDLLQLHFHAPSEEQLDGVNREMVLHLVHKNDKGKLAVVALLFRKGDPNAPLDEIFRQMPAQKEQQQELASLDLEQLLPADRSYFHFMGSLTTPPCTEGVKWFVLKQSATVSARQLSALTSIYRHTNRPVQMTNGRSVLSSN